MNLAKRVLFGLGLGRLSAGSNETGNVQMLQLAHRTGETQDGVPSVQTYGFASVPIVGCDHVVVYAEGDRSKGVAVASNDQRYRPKNMQPGEAQAYDNAGQSVYLKGGTQIVVTGKTSLVLQVGGVSLTISSSGFHFAGGPVTSDQDITAGSISLIHHVHTGVQPGVGNSGPPA